MNGGNWERGMGRPNMDGERGVKTAGGEDLYIDLVVGWVQFRRRDTPLPQEGRPFPDWEVLKDR